MRPNPAPSKDRPPVADLRLDQDWDGAPPNVPRHIAIIMDGNGRWAQERGLPRAIGHRIGVEAVRRTIKAAMELGVDYLTLYSFSTENWSRPETEISDLMGLMKRFIRRDLAELRQNGVRIHIIGERDKIDEELLQLIDESVEITRNNAAFNLIIAFNYGSKTEIALAAQRLAAQVASGHMRPEDITPERLEVELDTAPFPDPDLLIRTSGEQRLSNFLLWQCAYTELVFLPDYWPEFGEDLLKTAIAIYGTRDRRYGGLKRRNSA